MYLPLDEAAFLRNAYGRMTMILSFCGGEQPYVLAIG